MSSATRLQNGFAAVFGADAVDEGVVSFKGGIVLDAPIERLAFEHMPCGMAVALGFDAVQGVLDHGSPEESGRERMLAFEAGSRIEKEIDVAVALDAALEHEPAAYLSCFQSMKKARAVVKSGNARA